MELFECIQDTGSGYLAQNRCGHRNKHLQFSRNEENLQLQRCSLNFWQQQDDIHHHTMRVFPFFLKCERAVVPSTKEREIQPFLVLRTETQI